MSVRHPPVRPDLDRLEREAQELLRAIHAREPEAIADLAAFHPRPVDPSSAKLSDARLALARSYEAPSWTRLTQACDLIDAIWRDDLETVRELVTRHRTLLREDACVRPSDWGPPMTYAANLGRDAIIRMLYELGARDLRSAMERAALQGQVRTARLLYDLMGRPPLPDGALGGPGVHAQRRGQRADARVRRG